MQDSRYCEVVGHRVFHESPACRSYVALSEPQAAQTPPMGGYVAQAPVKAIRCGMVLKCGACGSLNMGPGTCRACGVAWVMP